MKMIIPAILTIFTFAVEPATAQPRPPYPPPVVRVPNLSGTWYMHGDPSKPAYIEQRPGDDQALFTNEHGSQAWGVVRETTVWIPEWTDGVSRGLEGLIGRGRIVWPNGTYWSVQPHGGFRPR